MAIYEMDHNWTVCNKFLKIIRFKSWTTFSFSLNTSRLPKPTMVSCLLKKIPVAIFILYSST